MNFLSCVHRPTCRQWKRLYSLVWLSFIDLTTSPLAMLEDFGKKPEIFTRASGYRGCPGADRSIACSLGDDLCRFRAGAGVVVARGRAGSEPGGLGFASGTGAQGLLNQLDQSGSVDQLNRMIGDELLGRKGKRAGGDKKPLVAAGMVDGAQELLKFGRAHDAAFVVLALHDRQHVLAAQAQVGALIAGAAGLLDLVAQRLEQLGHELLEGLGRQRRQLRKLELGPARLRALLFERLAPVANRLSHVGNLGRKALAQGGVGPIEITIDLEEGVLDRVVEPGSPGTRQLVCKPPEDRVPKMFESTRKLRLGADRGRLFAVRIGGPEQSLAKCDRPGLSRRALLHLGRSCPQPLQQHRGTLGTQTLHRFRTPLLLLASAHAGIAVKEDATP